MTIAIQHVPVKVVVALFLIAVSVGGIAPLVDALWLRYRPDAEQEASDNGP